MAAVDTTNDPQKSKQLFVFNYDDVVYPRDDYISNTFRAYYPCVNAPFINSPYWSLVDDWSMNTPLSVPNYTSCMLQSGLQWRPVGGCLGGSGMDQICSKGGKMSPLSKSRFGTLDDDFNGVKKWIYTDFGRTVVTPPRSDRGQYIPAMPYLQNGFALLQIAVQEVCVCHASNGFAHV
jgi:hypothetical protein